MTLPLVPLPVSVEELGSGTFRLDDAVRITGDADAAAELSALLEARIGSSPAVASAADDRSARTIELRLGHGGSAESYAIAADAASVHVVGADAAGLHHGVQTLGQLITPTDEGFMIPAVRIEDAPRFAYRGVMLDVARHFFPVETVLAYVDRAAGLKFNALHLHLSDDQGWRIQLHSRPELTALASASAVGGDPGGFYTKADYRRIVEHAASRHMIVVPEVDVPGHTHAVGLAYPGLVEEPVLSALVSDDEHAADAPPVAGVAYTGIAVGFSSLRIRDEATYDFIADVAGELAAMTPGPYLHIGGDEAHGTSPEDFADFMARATAIVADLGKTPIAWHEAGAAAGIHPSTVGQYWGFVVPTDGMDDKARAFVRNDAGLILSPADAVYLDMKDAADCELGLTWALGPTSLEDAYGWDPTEVIDGVGDDDILGVEAPMWTETIRTLDDIDRMAFPRIAAAAEIAWSPAPSSAADRTWDSFRGRVSGLGALWSSLGIRHRVGDDVAGGAP
jgi:hexosaminidase